MEFSSPPFATLISISGKPRDRLLFPRIFGHKAGGQEIWCYEFVNPKDHSKPVQEVIAEMTGGDVDRGIECTGNIDAMISAFERVHDGWGIAVLVGVPNKDDSFKTHPMNFLNERTLKGTYLGKFKLRSDLPSVVEKYMNRSWNWKISQRSTRPLNTCSKVTAFAALNAWENRDGLYLF